MIKIIFIAGDGRSGSTLLDAVLSNIEGSISVGECHRFWIRFYEGESLCSCNDMIGECALWSQVDQHLKAHFPNYNPLMFKRQVQHIQFYKNFKDIPNLVHQEEWGQFLKIVKAFYSFIVEISKKKVIIDSSKSISWAYLLQQIEGLDVRVIHLERHLGAVANSWKKKIQLPEYPNKKVWMPQKNNWIIIKTWGKIRQMSKKLTVGNYFFLRYESFCKDPDFWLKRVMLFVEESFSIDSLHVKKSHAIGGNPMRNKIDQIKINTISHKWEELLITEKWMYRGVYFLIKTFFR